MHNKIYLIKASNHYPVGNAGAVIIAANAIRAKQIADTLGLLDPKMPIPVGKSNLKEQIIFSNTTDY